MVGLALRANPQAPFERTATSYHEKYRGAGKTEPTWNVPRPPNLLNSGLTDGLELVRSGVREDRNASGMKRRFLEREFWPGSWNSNCQWHAFLAVLPSNPAT